MIVINHILLPTYRIRPVSQLLIKFNWSVACHNRMLRLYNRDRRMHRLRLLSVPVHNGRKDAANLLLTVYFLTYENALRNRMFQLIIHLFWQIIWNDDDDDDRMGIKSCLLKFGAGKYKHSRAITCLYLLIRSLNECPNK